jgi:hypothetical protein
LDEQKRITDSWRETITDQPQNHRSELGEAIMQANLIFVEKQLSIFAVGAVAAVVRPSIDPSMLISLAQLGWDILTTKN